jgi:MFS family permease
MLSEEGLADEYHHYSGKLDSMFQAALAVSGILGAFIANWSFPLLMWLSVIPQLLCLCISFQIVDSKKIVLESTNMSNHLKEAVLAFFQNPKLRVLNITSVMGFSIGETAYQFQATFYNLVLPIWAVGVAKTASNAFAFLGYQISGKVISKYKPFPIVAAGYIYSWISNIVALIFPTPISPFLMSSNSIFHGLGSTASGTLLQQEFTDKQRATMSSLNSFSGSLAFGVVAYFTGFVADRVGPIKTMILLQIIMLPTFWFLWKLYHISKNTFTAV